MKPQRLPVLMSYAYLRKAPSELQQEIFTDPRFELLVDSGAFTAFNTGEHISLGKYTEWLGRWLDTPNSNIVGYLALDVVQNLVETQVNLKAMLADGLKPIPVHIYGDEEQRMDELFGLSDWVALAGLRRPGRGQASQAYVKQKIDWAKGRKVHLLGYTKASVLAKLKPYSADSSSWVMPAKAYGTLALYMGKGVWFRGDGTGQRRYSEFMEKGLHLNEELRARVRHYGIDAADLVNRENWKRGSSLVVRLVQLSWVEYTLDFLRQFGVRIYLAAAPQDYRALCFALEAVTNTESG